MGSTGTHREKGLTNAEFFQRELFPSGNSIILPGAATIGGTFYAAVKTVGEAHGTIGEVWALVVLTQWTRDWFNFTYKEMSDTMGPAEREAPLGVLNKLTDTDNEYALQWRATCRTVAEQRAGAAKVLKGLKEGDKIVLGLAFRFADGSVRDKFDVSFRRDRAGRQQVMLTDSGLVRYRVPRWRQYVTAVIRGDERIEVSSATPS